jgi:pimeloyl-ACP methyl ester carboxylesterase
MGEVYRARDPRLGRDVAVKVLPAAFSADADRLRRFEQEARAAAALSHPNIVAIYDIGSQDGLPYVVSELLEGRSFREQPAGGAIPIKRVIDYATQVAAGLSVAHEKGIVHRDLKPENLFLTVDGRVKILDFGLAKLSEGLPAAGTIAGPAGATRAVDTGEGVVLGTVGYMSPEQVRAQAVDHRSDIFSFGAILYEMLSGERAFAGESAIDTLSAILNSQPRELSATSPSVPTAIDRLVARCLAKLPRDRFQSARDLVFALEMVADSPTAQTNRPAAVSMARDEPVEHTFQLSAAVCRLLNRAMLDPRVIGDHIEYADNQVESDTLVCFLHGTGLDYREFDHLLKRSPYHAVAPTLFGCEPERRRRTRLSMVDHLIIVREWLRDLVARGRPRTVVLVGHSTGADLWLEFVSAPVYDSAIPIDGLLLLDPNVSLETCWFTRVLATMTIDEPSRVLENLRSFGDASQSTTEWLNTHEYLVRVLRKFHGEIDVLAGLATDVVKPFEGVGLVAFAQRYRAATAAVPIVRFVFSEASRSNSDAAMSIKLANLDTQLLGGDYADDSIVSEPDADHFDLLEPRRLEPLLEKLVTAARNTNRKRVS